MTEDEELAHLRAPSTDPKQQQVDYWGHRAEVAEARLAQLLESAWVFAAHDWMDAELEDDGCKLTRHSGPITVGHWRRLRAAVLAADGRGESVVSAVDEKSEQGKSNG